MGQREGRRREAAAGTFGAGPTSSTVGTPTGALPGRVGPAARVRRGPRDHADEIAPVPPAAEPEIDRPAVAGTPAFRQASRRADEEGPPAPAIGAEPLDLGQQVMADPLAADGGIDDDALEPHLVVGDGGRHPHDHTFAAGSHDDGLTRRARGGAEMGGPLGGQQRRRVAVEDLARRQLDAAVPPAPRSAALRGGLGNGLPVPVVTLLQHTDPRDRDLLLIGIERSGRVREIDVTERLADRHVGHELMVEDVGQRLDEHRVAEATELIDLTADRQVQHGRHRPERGGRTDPQMDRGHRRGRGARWRGRRRPDRP